MKRACKCSNREPSKTFSCTRVGAIVGYNIPEGAELNNRKIISYFVNYYFILINISRFFSFHLLQTGSGNQALFNS